MSLSPQNLWEALPASQTWRRRWRSRYRSVGRRADNNCKLLTLQRRLIRGVRWFCRRYGCTYSHYRSDEWARRRRRTGQRAARSHDATPSVTMTGTALPPIAPRPRRHITTTSSSSNLANTLQQQICVTSHLYDTTAASTTHLSLSLGQWKKPET